MVLNRGLIKIINRRIETNKRLAIESGLEVNSTPSYITAQCLVIRSMARSMNLPPKDYETYYKKRIGKPKRH